MNGINHDGVMELLVRESGGGTFRSTGALLWTGQHILTAGHSVADNSGVNNVSSTGNSRAIFELSGGDITYNFRNDAVTVFPDFGGDLIGGGDIAIIDLGVEVDPSIPRYRIFDGDYADIVNNGVSFTFFGYGRSGTGDTGDTISSGRKRWGENEWDTTFSAQNLSLVYDFDNGLSAQNRIGGLGLGQDEANSAPGDSGGPNFIENPDAPGEYLIAGVTSWGLGGGSWDVTAGTDASFGELSGAANVAELADWIYVTVPEPHTLLMVVLSFGSLLIWKRP